MCKLCTYTTKHNNTLSMHYKHKHPQPNDIKYKCSMCDYESYNMGAVNNHIKNNLIKNNHIKNQHIKNQHIKNIQYNQINSENK